MAERTVVGKAVELAAALVACLADLWADLLVACSAEQKAVERAVSLVVSSADVLAVLKVD